MIVTVTVAIKSITCLCVCMTDCDQYGILLSDPVWKVDSKDCVWASAGCRTAGSTSITDLNTFNFQTLNGFFSFEIC